MRIQSLPPLMSLLMLLVVATEGICALPKAALDQGIKDVYVSLRFENEPVISAFRRIENTTRYTFSYNVLEVEGKRVSGDYVRQSLFDVLMDFSRQLNLEFRQYRDVINVRPKSKTERTIPVEVAIDSDFRVRGRVLNKANGEPLPGVSVMVKQTTVGTVTDFDGNYVLDVPDENAVLVFSFIGFETQEQPVNGRSVIEVSLEETAQALEEVVIVGYGSVRKSDLTGSVGTVDLDDLVEAPVASFADALAGRVAGVEVSSNDGQPGAGQQIVIRGAGSLTQSTAPLYVVDGFPMEDFDPASLNSDDIKSISVLKDASATAIYGARAANGVVVIETKKGMEGRPVISLRSSVGFQRIQKEMEVMTPYEFVSLQYELDPTRATNKYLQDGKTLESYRDMPGIDWQEHVFHSRPTHIHSLSMRGGNKQTKYSVSGSLYDQQGVVLNTGYRRHQARLSLEQTVSKKMKIGVNVNYSNIGTFGEQAASGAGSDPSTYLFYNVWGYRPVSGDEDLDLLAEDYDPDHMGTSEARTNPIKTLENSYNHRKNKQLLGNLSLNYKITDDLTLRLMGGVNNRMVRSDVFHNSKSPRGNPNNPLNIRGVNGAMNYSEVYTWSSENTLTYKKNLSKDHELTAMAGFSMQGRQTNSNGVSIGFVPNEELGISGLDEGTPWIARSASSEFKQASFFGRLNYGYQSKYLVTATFRGDASSKFAPENRWGFFPSAAVAWNMAEEPFMQSLRFVSTSKLRASFGLTGNNRVSDFAYLSTLSLPQRESYSFNNMEPTKGVVPDDLGNNGLKWEAAEQIDIGLDLGLFQNRVELTVDVYRKTTKDLLLNANIPYTTGFGKAFMNIGSIENEGLEISLNTVNVHTKTFQWRSGFNIGFNRNEVLALSQGEEKLFSFIEMTSAYNNTPLYVAEVGQPVSMFYGYIFDGIYQYEDFDEVGGQYLLKPSVPTNGSVREQIQPGDIRYKDLNDDGVVNAYDQAIIGRAIPIHTGGFTNNFYYKGFDLNVLFQWSYGNDVYNANRLLLEGNGLARTDMNQFKSYVDRWKPDNPSNTNFRAGGQGPLGMHSTRVLEDGSYVRLKTISLGYTLPASVVKAVHIDELRLYVAAQNLWTWTNYSGMDPEVSVRNSVLTRGFDYSAYPNAQTLVFGLNATF